MEYLWKTVLNQKFFIKYVVRNIQIYEIITNNQTKLFLTFKTEAEITSIQFNPFVENIILISFMNGICKIYNIFNKNNKEDILFENINKERINISLFNNFDPNIIATVSDNNSISIWDVRKLFYLNILNIDNEIIKVKWSYYGKNYLEYVYNKEGKNKIELIDIYVKNIVSSLTISEELINFLYLKDNILILIKKGEIEKINFEIEYNPIKTEKIKIDKIIYSNENLIEENNILPIISLNKIFLIDIVKFLII